MHRCEPWAEVFGECPAEPGTFEDHDQDDPESQDAEAARSLGGEERAQGHGQATGRFPWELLLPVADDISQLLKEQRKENPFYREIPDPIPFPKQGRPGVDSEIPEKVAAAVAMAVAAATVYTAIRSRGRVQPSPAFAEVVEAKLPAALQGLWRQQLAPGGSLAAKQVLDSVWNNLGGSQWDRRRKRWLEDSTGPGTTGAVEDPDVPGTGPTLQPEADYGEWYYHAFGDPYSGTSVNTMIRGPSWVNPEDPRWAELWGGHWSWGREPTTLGFRHPPGSTAPGNWEDDPTTFEPGPTTNE